MLSLTAKFCCNRLPLRNSMLVTDTFGRLNLGVREQAARQSIQAASKPQACAAAGTALFKIRRYAPMTRLYRKVPWASPMAQCGRGAEHFYSKFLARAPAARSLGALGVCNRRDCDCRDRPRGPAATRSRGNAWGPALGLSRIRRWLFPSETRRRHRSQDRLAQ